MAAVRLSSGLGGRSWASPASAAAWYSILASASFAKPCNKQSSTAQQTECWNAVQCKVCLSSCWRWCPCTTFRKNSTAQLSAAHLRLEMLIVPVQGICQILKQHCVIVRVAQGYKAVMQEEVVIVTVPVRQQYLLTLWNVLPGYQMHLETLARVVRRRGHKMPPVQHGMLNKVQELCENLTYSEIRKLCLVKAQPNTFTSNSVA